MMIPSNYPSSVAPLRRSGQFLPQSIIYPQKAAFFATIGCFLCRSMSTPRCHPSLAAIVYKIYISVIFPLLLNQPILSVLHLEEVIPPQRPRRNTYTIPDHIPLEETLLYIIAAIHNIPSFRTCPPDHTHSSSYNRFVYTWSDSLPSTHSYI